jgi:hypothetical protein
MRRARDAEANASGIPDAPCTTMAQRGVKGSKQEFLSGQGAHNILKTERLSAAGE